MNLRHLTKACHPRRLPRYALLLAVAGVLSVAPSAWASQGKKSVQEQARQEEAGSYYKKWLEEDVVYIISPEEKAVFDSLTTSEEKDQFIEQFWHRRDPTPTTVENEFKIEHYRRIAYVNERYFSGVPGWKTDRGKIYIRFGEPDSKERQPYGGPYRRPTSEGGGETTVFPFEKWWYAHIEGVGDDIEIEFVDKNFTNEYRISINPNDKDAFLFTPGHGSTQDELDGITSRFDRVSAPLGIVDVNSPLLHRRDLPFVKLRRWAQLQKNPEIRNKRLQQVIDANVRYDQFPFQYRVDWLRLDDKALVPLTVSIDNSDLHFGEDGKGGQAGINLFGRVKNLQGRIVSIFEDEIVQAKQGEAVLQGRSLYQKMLLLDPGRYRLDLILEDSNAGRLGTAQAGFLIPRIQQGQLTASPVILVDRVQPLSQEIDTGELPEMFVLGTMKVVPRIGEVLPPETKHSMFYFQLYNAGIDSSTQMPQLDLTYQLIENGQVAEEKKDTGGSRAAYVSNQRVVLLEYLSLRKTSSPSLKLRIQVEDKISGQSLTIEKPFRVSRKEAKAQSTQN